MNKHVLLLSEPINFAVVQLPDRKFPGVVCQGDTLYSLIKELNSMLLTLKDRDFEELEYQIDSMREKLSIAQAHYENICKLHNIELPYTK